MGKRAIGLAVALAWILSWPSVCLAGMPSLAPVLTDWGLLRLSTISFFLVVILSATVAVRWLWNGLAADFSRLPRLSYRNALAAVLLWGLALAVVLTMIAGARELLTPGAWQKDGLLYKVAAPWPSEPATDPLAERRENLQRLQIAPWRYAGQHGGRFPANVGELNGGDSLWEAPGGAGMHYFYVAGLKAGAAADLLVCEPAVHGDERLVLYTNGELATLPSSEIRTKLQAEKRP